MVAEGSGDTSRLALGTVQWGLPYGIANSSGPPGASAIAEMIRAAKQAGVDTIDTAHAYGDSEAVVGDATAGDPHWTVVTKLAPDLTDNDVGIDEALSRTRTSLALSRRRLRRSTLPIMLLHRAHHRAAFGGAIWRFLRDRQEAGEIALLGLSAGSPEEALEAVSADDVSVIQVASSLLDQRLTRTDFFERANDSKKLIQVRSVYLQGVAHLKPDALPPHLAGLVSPLRTITEFAHANDCSVEEMFLSFAQRLPVDRVVVGSETPNQLRKNIEMWQTSRLPPQLISEAVRLVPDLDDRLLDPSRWSSR